MNRDEVRDLIDGHVACERTWSIGESQVDVQYTSATEARTAVAAIKSLLDERGVSYKSVEVEGAMWHLKDDVRVEVVL